MVYQPQVLMPLEMRADLCTVSRVFLYAITTDRVARCKHGFIAQTCHNGRTVEKKNQKYQLPCHGLPEKLANVAYMVFIKE